MQCGRCGSGHGYKRHSCQDCQTDGGGQSAKDRYGSDVSSAQARTGVETVPHRRASKTGHAEIVAEGVGDERREGGTCIG